MADNPLQDNTRAQEQQTEALQQLNQQLNPSSSGANVGDLLRTVAEIARLQARAAAESRPTPPRSNYSSPPPPSPPSPPGGNGVPPPPPPPAPGGNNPPPHRDPVARRLTDEEAARIAEQEKRNKPPAPPPLAPHERMLHASIGATMERLQELQDYYRANPQAQASDLAAKGLRGEAAAHEDFVGKQFAGLSKEEQAKAMPAMQALEQRRRQVEEAELQRREKMNKELTRGEYAMANFARSLAGGHVFGALGSLAGGIGGLPGVLASVGLAAADRAIKESERYRGEVARGGAALSPSGESTEEASRRLLQMQQARDSGELDRQRNAAYLDQARRTALRAGMSPRFTPELWQNYMIETQGMTREEVERARLTLGEAERARARLQLGRQPIRAESEYNRIIGEFYERFAREHGQDFQFRQNIVMPGGGAVGLPPAQGGITSAMAFQAEMQTGVLATRQDVNQEILQEQLRVLRDMRIALIDVNQNTNGLEFMNPRWSP